VVPSSHQPSSFIIERLRAAGFSAFLVGGCVRDMLLGLPPKDYDVATAALPDQIAQLFPGSFLVGAQFGVVLVRQGDAQVEVATFRRDHDYQDGRRPGSVSFERDPRQDVLRRDFTINALLLDPESGEVTDYVGGRDDLRRSIVRAIGDPGQRFKEDHLRLLRAVRFAARLEFEIEPETFEAIRQNASLIRYVAAERVRDELSAMLVSAHPRRAFELLSETGLLTQILPEIEALRGVEQPPEFHPEGDVWTHTMIMLDGLRRPTLTLALGVLLHDVGKPATFERAPDRIRFNGHVEAGVRLGRPLLHRLRFSNDRIDQVLALITNHMKFMEVTRMKESTVKRFLRMPGFEEHMALHRLDCLSSHGSLSNYEWLARKQLALPPEQIKPPLLLTGRDLIDAGYIPGPRFKTVLHTVEEAQLNGEIETAAQAMALVQRLWPA
jgi:putative nucleotidyltransferase with HDIG domain